MGQSSLAISSVSALNSNQSTAAVSTVLQCKLPVDDGDRKTDQCRPTATRVSEKGFTHTHTTVLLLFWNMSGTTRVSRYQKGKTRQVKTFLVKVKALV